MAAASKPTIRGRRLKRSCRANMTCSIIAAISLSRLEDRSVLQSLSINRVAQISNSVGVHLIMNLGDVPWRLYSSDAVKWQPPMRCTTFSAADLQYQYINLAQINFHH